MTTGMRTIGEMSQSEWHRFLEQVSNLLTSGFSVHARSDDYDLVRTLDRARDEYIHKMLGPQPPVHHEAPEPMVFVGGHKVLMVMDWAEKHPEHRCLLVTPNGDYELQWKPLPFAPPPTRTTPNRGMYDEQIVASEAVSYTYSSTRTVMGLCSTCGERQWHGLVVRAPVEGWTGWSFRAPCRPCGAVTTHVAVASGYESGGE